MNPTEAARAVLIEVVNMLGVFKDDLVIVGGWVPDLKFPGKQHVGSLDVDLAVGPGARGDNAYSTIRARLTEGGYSLSAPPTRFLRDVPGVADPVRVDLISGQYVDDARGTAVMIDELSLSALRGIDLAFVSNEEITVEGTMPDGSHNVVQARIVSTQAFILIKAFALAERINKKDAYDIAFILRYYEPSLAALAEQLMPLVNTGLGAEAYQILVDKFSQFDAVGPTGGAEVAETSGENREQFQRAAFENAQELFEEVRGLQP